jgi:predicted pyridoxine 5'-phosphate oxidase superfamily flavin-nucleotide-binding protein
VRYHGGERAVQRRAGGEEIAARLLRGVQDELPYAAREFLADQPMLIVASTDGDDVRADLQHGPPGFISAPDEHTVHVVGRTIEGPVGLLALEPATRRRMRVNGEATPTATGFAVSTDEVYSNCPKYIQRREIVGLSDEASGRPREATRLSESDRALIAGADTFFVATAAHGSADASHRGGSPGFVSVDADGLSFPDYPGNNMYGTLGNLLANPRIGLLFLDWETGDTLQLTGAAEIDLASRAVRVTIERAIRTPNALPLRWVLLERSRFNP